MTLADILAALQGQPTGAAQPVRTTPEGGLDLRAILAGAQVDQQRSPYERTMRPGETRSAGDVQDMLAEVILAAGSGALPGVGPRGQARQAPARIRNVWHGSQAPIEGSFDPARATNAHSQALGVPTYHFTNNRNMAGSYGPVIQKFKVNTGRELKIDAAGKTFDEILPEVEAKFTPYKNELHQKWAKAFRNAEQKYGEGSVQYGEAPAPVIKKLDRLHAEAMATPKSDKTVADYDSIVIKNVWDWGIHNNTRGKIRPYSDVVVALRPEQIAKGNE